MSGSDQKPIQGALVFEVWRKPSSGEYSVRTYFSAQTLEQMRSSAPLTLAGPPERVPVFIPGRSRAELSCTLAAFLQLLDRVSDKRAVLQH